jgi:CRP-like cAMP-binding protein
MCTDIASTTAMRTPAPAPMSADDDQVAAYARGVIEAASATHLPELFAAPQPHALYFLPNRHGVAVTALRSADLTEEQIIQLLRYRLAQYLSVQYVDPRMVFAEQMWHEPPSHVLADDVHVMAADAMTGELLCYLVIESVGAVPREATLRERDRPLIALEQVYGWGIYNRLRILPDLPLGCVREIGRFAKNQRLPSQDERVIRAPVETLVAVAYMLSGILHSDVDDIVGIAEEDVALENLAFFQLPLIVIHGNVALPHPDTYLYYPALLRRNHYPFAFPVADVPCIAARVAAVEQALTMPREQALRELLRLKREARTPRSTLEPQGGLPLLDTVGLLERRTEMPVRARLRAMGEWLRTCDLFRDLSDGEATVLGTLLEHVEVAADTTILAQGKRGDGMYLIHSGFADVRIRSRCGTAVCAATLGFGSYVGEIGLMTHDSTTADVVARTPMTLLRLNREVYTLYLSQLDDVRLRFAHAAAAHAAENARTRMMLV